MASPAPQHEPTGHWMALLTFAGGVLSTILGYLGHRREQVAEPMKPHEFDRLNALEDTVREMREELADHRRAVDDDRRANEMHHGELAAMIRALAGGRPN